MPSTVVVIGGGLSGLSAAHTALDHGHNVVLVERNAFMGGNSTKATSGINGGGTNTQRKMGIEDSKEAFEEDTIRGATGVKKGPCPPSYPLGRVLSHNSAAAVEWCQSKFGLGLDTVSRLGGHSFPRTHRTKNGTTFPGMEITYALMTRYEELCEKEPNRAKLIVKSRVQRLGKDSQGRINAVYYKTRDGTEGSVQGDAFVIATGGYGAGGLFEGSTLHKVRPELTHLPTTNGEHCTGDGIAFAQDIGANAVDLKHVQVHPTGLVHMTDNHNRTKFLAAEALRGEGGILLDNEGKRFCNDIGTRDYVTGMMWKNNKAPYRLILNSKASKGISWHCKHYVGRNVMKKCHGNEIAKDLGISPAQLQSNFDDYNRAATSGQDTWGKKYFDGTPYKVDDDFYCAIVTPVVHYTMGGLNISEQGEVLAKATGYPIPGLFAAGEVTGGVHMKNRLGGSALLECVVFGRVTGSSAHAYIKAGRPVSSERGVPANDWTIQGDYTNRPPNTDAYKYPSTGKPVPKVEKKVAKKKGAKNASGLYTLEEVAQHNTDDDCWVAVNGQVLDVTPFLEDHPGGKMAIMTFAGKDATEEFNMVHDSGVVEKYAKHLVIGKVRPGSKL